MTLLPLLFACLPPVIEDTAAPTDTADTADTGDCMAVGLCPLEVSNVTTSSGDPTAERALTVVAAAAGSIEVTDTHFYDGCCPQLTVEAELHVGSATIVPNYTILSDDCECEAALTLSYSVSGIPAGSYTVEIDGLSAAVAVQ